jgi:hypothetical protein
LFDTAADDEVDGGDGVGVDAEAWARVAASCLRFRRGSRGGGALAGCAESVVSPRASSLSSQSGTARSSSGSPGALRFLAALWVWVAAAMADVDVQRTRGQTPTKRTGRERAGHTARTGVLGGRQSKGSQSEQGACCRGGGRRGG